jgi:hypothetical protein
MGRLSSEKGQNSGAMSGWCRSQEAFDATQDIDIDDASRQFNQV